MVSHLYMAEAAINELPLYLGDQAPFMPGCTDFERAECFYACLQALKRVADNFFTFTSKDIFGHAMPLHLHFCRSTHIFYRLSLTDDRAWDRATVSRTIDLLGALDRGAAMYEAVPIAAGLETDGSDIFTKGGNALRAAIPIWRRVLEESGAIPRSADTCTDSGMGPELRMNPSVDPWFMDVFSMGNMF